MIASLAMYDWPELRSANETLYERWRARLCDRGLEAPATLRRQELRSLWQDPQLLVAQTCGLPFGSGMCGDAQLLATPCYDVVGCEGPYYRSVFVARRSERAADLLDFEGERVAVNSWSSQSGFNALRHELVRRGVRSRFFSATYQSGSHRASMHAVAGGLADLAAIDCVLWAHAQTYEPRLVNELCEVGSSNLAPGLPLICSGLFSPERVALLRETLREVLEDPETAEARRRLRLRDFEVLPAGAYRVLSDQRHQEPAMAWG